MTVAQLLKALQAAVKSGLGPDTPIVHVCDPNLPFSKQDAYEYVLYDVDVLPEGRKRAGLALYIDRRIAE